MRNRHGLSRRQFLQTTGLGAAALALAACVQPGAAPGAGGEAAAPDAAVREIEFGYYNWGPASIQYFEDMAAAFEESHPGTTIRLTLPPDAEYTTKLQIMLATGDGPDIITTTSLTPKLLEEGRLLDLTDLVMADEIMMDPERFIQAGWDIYRYNTGQIYGVYSGADTHLLYYNKDLFDQASVGYPTPDWTWDDFLEAALALTVVEGDRTVQWGTTLGILVASWGMANLVWEEGGDIVDQRPSYTQLTLDNEPVIKVLQFLQDMVHVHKVAPAPSQANTLGEAAGFESGRVAMVLDGGWSIQSRSEIDAFQWDVQKLPKGTAGFWSAFWPGTPMQISASTDEPELAWEYVRWFAASEEGQDLVAKQLIQVPARLDIALSETFLTQPGLPPNAQAWAESLKQAKPGDTIHVNQQEMMDKVWQPNWDRYIENNMTAEAFASTVETEGNAILEGS